MTILEATYRLCNKIWESPDREEIMKVVSKLTSSSRGYGNKIYPIPVLGLLLWPQEGVKEFTGRAPWEELASWTDRERNLLFGIHSEILNLNELCLKPLKSELPDCSLAVNPYQPYPAEKIEESPIRLISDEDAQEIAKVFHEHPAFKVALSDLSIVKQNEHHEHYVQHFWELNKELVNARPGGEVGWTERFSEARKGTDADSIFVRHLAALICLRSSLGNLDQLIYQALFQPECPHLDPDVVIESMWSPRTTGLAIWLVYLPNRKLFLIHAGELVLVSLNSEDTKNWLCQIVNQSLSGSFEDWNTAELLKVDENLNCYPALIR
jgi:hypothetical protein